MPRKKKTENSVVPPVEETQEKKVENKEFRLKLYRSQLIKLNVIDIFMTYIVNNIFHMGPESLNVTIEGNTYIVKDLRNVISKIQSGIDMMMGRKDIKSYNFIHQYYNSLEYTLDMQRLAGKLSGFIKEFYKADNASIVIEIPQKWLKTAKPDDLIGLYILQDYFENVVIEYY